MKTAYRTLCVLSTLAGLALVGVQVRLNLEAAGGDLTSGLALAGVVLPVAMVLAVVVLEHRLAVRQYGLALVALAVLLSGMSHTLIVALERNVAAREAVAGQRELPNQERAMALEGLVASRKRVAERQAAEDVACRQRGRSCVAARDQVVRERRVIAELEARLAKLPSVRADGMHARYGALAEAIDLWHPVLLPFALEAGGLVLVGFGMAGGRRRFERVAAPVDLRVVPPPRLSVRQEARLSGRSKSAVHRSRQRQLAVMN
jgi:hypothetical protein